MKSLRQSKEDIAYQEGRIEALQGKHIRADRYLGTPGLRSEYLEGYADGLLDQIRGSDASSV